MRYTKVLILITLPILLMTNYSSANDGGPDKLNAEKWYEKGNAYLVSNDVQKAIEASTIAINLDQNYGEAYLLRCGLYMTLDRYDEAISDCNRAMTLDPTFAASVYSLRGHAYTNKGEYDQAIADCNKALELRPRFSMAYITRARALISKKQYDKAILDSDKALQINPGSDDAYTARGLAYLMKGNYQMAIADSNKALGINPMCAKAYACRGIAHNFLGDKEQAGKDLIAAARLGDKSVQKLLRSAGIDW
jgi:tetratricopeptide (TPR) repeat protein